MLVMKFKQYLYIKDNLQTSIKTNIPRKKNTKHYFGWIDMDWNFLTVNPMGKYITESNTNSYNVSYLVD